MYIYLQNVRSESAAAASDKEGKPFQMRRDTADRVRTAQAEFHSGEAAHRQVVVFIYEIIFPFQSFYNLHPHSTGSMHIFSSSPFLPYFLHQRKLSARADGGLEREGRWEPALGAR